MLKLRIALALLILVSTASATTFHGDAARTGNFTDYGPKTAELVYKVPLYPIHGSPVVWNGSVYVIADAAMDGSTEKSGLYRIDANNGSVIWHYKDVFGMSTPAVDENGYIYVHVYNNNSKSGELMSFYPNETLRWNVTIESKDLLQKRYWLVSSSPLVYNDSVYVLSYSGKLFKFDLNGNEVWNLSVGSEANSIYMSSPSAWNGTIYFVANVSNTYKLFAVSEDKTERWNRTLLGIPKATPVIYDGKVIIPTTERLYVFDAVTGDELWNLSFDGTLSTPAVFDNKLYIANKTTVFCFDLQTMEELWNFTAIKNAGRWDSIASSIAVADGVVYFATNTANGTIYALNSTTKELIWKYETNNYIMSSPFIYNGKLYIGADDGNLYIFGLWKGTVLIDEGTFTVKDTSGKEYRVSNFTVLGVLQKLNETFGISYSVYNYSGNLYLSSLGGVGMDVGWWMTEINGRGIDKGMQFENVSDGDVVTFWLYPKNPTYSVSAKNAPYLVEVRVKAKLVEINDLNVSNGKRGGYINATVNITPYYTGWLVVVVSGTNSNGDSIAGLSTVYVTHQQPIKAPVMIVVPQQVQTGTYRLYVGVYKLEDFPNKISEYTTTPATCTIS